MTIAVTAQQSFTRPGFSAQFLHSQTGGIFEHNVGYTTQHHPISQSRNARALPIGAGAAQDRQAIPAAA